MLQTKQVVVERQLALEDSCKYPVGPEALEYHDWMKEFGARIDAAPHMDKEKSDFLNTHLLEADLAPVGLWLKFGVDMTCDEGACNKFGPLSEHSLKKEGTAVYGFDWFKGLPEDWRRGFTVGAFGGRKVPKAPEGVTWVVGKYQDSLPKFLKEHVSEKVGYLMVDSDLCSSSAFILDQVYPQLSEGALVYFDEIMNFSQYYEGEMLSFFRFLKKNNLDYEVVMASDPFIEGAEENGKPGGHQAAAFRLRPKGAEA